MEIIRTKKDFIERVRLMEFPILEEFALPYYPLLNLSFIISSKKDYHDKFYTRVVRLGYKEYERNCREHIGHTDYHKREKVLRHQVSTWFKEATTSNV